MVQPATVLPAILLLNFEGGMTDVLGSNHVLQTRVIILIQPVRRLEL